MLEPELVAELGGRPRATAPLGSSAPLSGFLPATSFSLQVLVASFSLECSLVGEEALVLDFVIFSLIPSKFSFFSPDKSILSSKVFRAALAA